MPEDSDNILEVGAVLAVLDTRLAAVNANWNGQGPDLMSPAELKAFSAATLALNQACGMLVLSVGAYAGRTLAGAAAGRKPS